MFRTVPWLLFAAALAVAPLLGGCGHLSEQRVVRRFGEALSEEDLDRLGEATSENFRTAALGHEGALGDLRLLRLPTEGLTVIDVIDVPEDERLDRAVPEKLVTAETDRPRRQFRYRLVQTGGGGFSFAGLAPGSKWVVDDVLLKQKRGGVRAVRSVTEQMELFAAVRLFTDAWEGDDAAAKLAVLTPDLRDTLDDLPPARLAELSGWLVGGGMTRNLRPTAELNGDDAAVEFNGRRGTLRLSLERVDPDTDDARWLVDDAAAAKKDGPKIPSLRKTAVALNSVTRFLDAYAAGDAATLEEVTDRGLYDGSLAGADLSLVPLPTSAALGGDSEFHVESRRADLTLNTADGVVTIAMTPPAEIDGPRSTSAAARPFRVREVTLHTPDGQRKRLSSVFTAHGTFRRFAAALSAGDLAGLRAKSTQDLNETVWDRVDAAGLWGLPVAAAAADDLTVTAELYDGPITEITVAGVGGVNAAGDGFAPARAPRPVTFVLRDEAGSVRVDDVLTPLPDRPQSLKQTCALVLPARALQTALLEADLGGVRRVSSRDFNDRVWHQLDAFPAPATAAAAGLGGPLAKVLPGDPDASTEGPAKRLLFGTETDGVMLHLVTQRDRLVVDEVELLAGVHPDQRVGLKRVLREQLADGTLRLMAAAPDLRPVPTTAADDAFVRRDPAVTPAGFTDPPLPPAGPSGTHAGGVMHAEYTTPADDSPFYPDPNATPLPSGDAATGDAATGEDPGIIEPVSFETCAGCGHGSCVCPPPYRDDRPTAPFNEPLAVPGG